MMTKKDNTLKVLLVLLFALCSIVCFSQSTLVRGVVRDDVTKQPLQYVTVFFKGGRGTVTDSTGQYVLQTTERYAQIELAHVGYVTTLKKIKAGIVQSVDVDLERDVTKLNDVTVNSKNQGKYRNKNNPAVELIKKVIDNKDKNQTSNYNFAQYEKYQKLKLSLSKISDKITKGKLFKDFNFIFKNRDTTTVQGLALFPVYMEETLSKNYFRKSPEKNKEIITAEKKVNYGEYIDQTGVSEFLNRLYEDINIYDNNISLFTNQFLSPISDAAPTFYMYYIRDTITDADGKKLVQLYFTPRNPNDLLFRGTLFITLDGNYAVQRLNMFVSRNVNLNWIREMKINQDFQKNDDGRYHLSKSYILTEAAIARNRGNAIYGERTVSFKDYKINIPLPDSVYDGATVTTLAGADNYQDSFWAANRHDTLNYAESKVYGNMDSLVHMRSYKRIMNIARLIVAGYDDLGPFEVGPVNTFYSFNSVEGFKLRFGGRSTPKLSRRLYFETYGAYGFKDERFKYFLSTTYSINNQSIYQFPLNLIRVSYQYDTKIPGQELQFVSEDNLLLSFKRGGNDRLLYDRTFKIENIHELPNHFSTNFTFKNLIQQPAGSISYKLPNNTPVKQLTTSEVSAELRWAPHEQFFQGPTFRRPVINKYPIITLRIAAGIKGLFNGEYNYQTANLVIKKRAYLSQLGFSDVRFEGGYVFGQVPFPLLDIHRANQTYSYQLNAYNLMNFMEFVSDHYASVIIDHHFNGFFFNKIPLLKKLKLREFASIRSLWGGMRRENNPTLITDPAIYKFPTDTAGVPTTYSLNHGAYIEGSIGIGNILKFVRLDLVKRFTYLDHPNISKLGIRALVRFDF